MKSPNQTVHLTPRASVALTGWYVDGASDLFVRRPRKYGDESQLGTNLQPAFRDYRQ